MGSITSYPEITTTDDLVIVVDGSYGTKRLLASDLVNLVAESADWRSHNLYFRGKNLGDKFTPEQLKEIRNGTFQGLLVGDYWEIMDSDENVHRWRIVHINYWKGLWGQTTPHIVVMPDDVLYATTYGATNNGYSGSLVRTEGLKRAKELIKEAFDGHIMEYSDPLSYSVNQTTGLVDGNNYNIPRCSVELPSEIMIFGTSVLVPRNNPGGGASLPVFYNSDTVQFALMRLCPEFINVTPNKPYTENGYYLLRDIYYSDRVGGVTPNRGVTHLRNTINAYGIRPIAAIG